MGVEFLKIISKYATILILVMFLKAISAVEISNIANIDFVYKEVQIVKENIKYNKPEFNNEYLNNFVDTYINENLCTYLDYNIYELADNKVNVFLNCGTPKNIIYSLYLEQSLSFESIIKNNTNFSENVVRLLNLKYPSFVTEEISPLAGTYNIKSNELTGYFNTINYGLVTLKINNNEIKDILNYEMIYDENYENEVYTLDKNKKTIAFSFDDGPSNYDLEIIDYLKNSHSTATFFLVGNRINNYKDSVFKMIEAGMEVGNHTYDHKSLVKLSDQKIKEQINKTNNIFKELTSREMKLLRPTYGAVNKKVLLSVGMPSILWNIDTLDWKTRDSQKVYDSIINDVQDGDIVLMHSLYKSTADAVKMVLPELYKRGFQVVSISELFELKGKTLEIGKSYTSLR